MPDIYLIKTSSNMVTWDHTRDIVIANGELFGGNVEDFGAGEEPSFVCPGCGRELPVALADLDHIRSQARYTKTNLGILSSDSFAIYDDDCDQVEAAVNATGGYVTIQTGSKYNPKIGYTNADQIWRCDLSNLQLLCPICNSSKGAKDWETWGRSEEDTRPLSDSLEVEMEEDD